MSAHLRTVAHKFFFLFLQAVLYAVLFWYSTIVPSHAFSAEVPVNVRLEAGKHAVVGRTGCYLLDYSFLESVNAWIFAEHLSPTRIRKEPRHSRSAAFPTASVTVAQRAYW